ncbi:hypothetical protein J7T55_002747 [Diaporthe amygdali]|uniref:uncharacterized protein n=1 Tax=Phomopsis amygdali TaxID=1214568 RepID=UPI0022FE3C66|nr:uncharacterized protein J7T55_002747 [Diaporthe amygdali]KAJ0122235.1 hypothetical protein J7T55_002747 [Diaporthe amygdali]
MIMSTQNRGRPSLEINTDYAGPSDIRLRSAFRKHRSPLPSATPNTPKTLPSPIQPSTPAYDVSMRQHERAMVESLEARGGLSRSLSPVAEQSMSTRVNLMTMDSPVQSRTAAHPLTAPNTPLIASLSHGRQNMVQQTRSMLLSGMSPSQASNVGAVSNRKLSAPAEAIQRQRRQTMMLLQPDMLQAWGHVYLGDPTKADVLVAPSALRRLSGTEQPDSAGEGYGQSERLFIRARVRPKGKERKPFLIARSFNLNELRATLPSPATPLSAAINTALSSEPASVYCGLVQSDVVSIQSPTQERFERDLPYARAYLPALAAVMLSGHVKTGDTIDLPMPHPEAWTQTVAYAYTGRGEATEAVKQNMLHLGGRV